MTAPLAPGGPRTDDASAMDHIAALLDGRAWDADTLDHIADLVRKTGRLVRDVDGVLPAFRITYEDARYEPLDGE